MWAASLARYIRNETLRTEKVYPPSQTGVFLVHLLSFTGNQELSCLMSDIGPYWTTAILHMFSHTLTTDRHVHPQALPFPPVSPGNLCKSTQQSREEKRINLYQHCTFLLLSPCENKRGTVQNLIQYSLGIILTWLQENKSFSNPQIQGILSRDWEWAEQATYCPCGWQRHLPQRWWGLIMIHGAALWRWFKAT